jgi:hypothetical protein
VCFEYGDDGRPSGNANVDFDSEPAAREAMKKHRNMMGSYNVTVEFA